ncbi:NUDIX hydrolase [uncultured Jatrophihabitans sp.]|uniref:NUDIX hydrolase n=1 Tax=uncultured Jatrophihabitans sp. TaxID=1610747 RepID=UPI0035CBD237
MTPVPRVGGRVLIVDPDERVLLVHERIEDASTHWLTPGGGVEDGEEPRDAAAREAMEEVGLDVAVPADQPAVLITRRLWSWAGVTYDQVDHFFLARVAGGLTVQPQGLTAMERQTVLGHAWWSITELRATGETLLPPDLADLLDRVLHDTASTLGDGLG